MTIFTVVTTEWLRNLFSQYCIFPSSTTNSLNRSARCCTDWCHGSSKNEKVKLREKLKLLTWLNGGKYEGREGPRNSGSCCFTQTLCWLSQMVSLIGCGGVGNVSDDAISGGGRVEGGDGIEGTKGMLANEELEEPSQGVMKLFWKVVEMGGWARFLFLVWVVMADFSEEQRKIV